MRIYPRSQHKNDNNPKTKFEKVPATGKSEKELNVLAKTVEKPLMQISSVFPFDLFPNSIVVDKKKVDIIHRYFFWSKRVFTIFIHDVRTVRVDNGPFFANVSFEVKGFEQNPEPVPYIKKSEAEKLRKLVIGLCAADSENIDIENIPDERAKNKLKKIGKVY